MLGIIANFCGLMFSNHCGGLRRGACGVVWVMMGLPLMVGGRLVSLCGGSQATMGLSPLCGRGSAAVAGRAGGSAEGPIDRGMAKGEQGSARHSGPHHCLCRVWVMRLCLGT